MRVLSSLLFGGLVLLVLPGAAAGTVQTVGNINIGSTCWDSLPYGVEHACQIVYPNTTRASLGALYTTVATLVAADSLIIARRDSADTGVAIIVSPQPAQGLCTQPRGGPVLISPTIAVRFEARPRGNKEARYLVVVRGTAVSAEGNAGGMFLALCSIGRYALPLDSLPTRDSGH